MDLQPVDVLYGHTALPIGFLWLCLSMPGILGCSGDSIKGTSSTRPKSYIRMSPSVSAGELVYINKRKVVVLDALKRMGIQTTLGSVPYIALLASGGGQRAAVSLIGSLYQLYQDALLDTLMYLGGVSGSTWDPAWSSTMAQEVSRLAGPGVSPSGVSLEKALQWLAETSKDQLFSLSDVWGLYTSAGIMKQLDMSRLSEEAKRDATNPYPVYNVLEQDCFHRGSVKGQWFELTPHEAGFTELGLYVNTSLLGSSFHRGQLQEARPEMDMVRLQGIMGSAIADKPTILETLINVPPGSSMNSTDITSRSVRSLSALIILLRDHTDNAALLADLDKLQNILNDTFNLHPTPLFNVISITTKSILDLWKEISEPIERWSQTLVKGPFQEFVSLVITKVFPLIQRWEWGTTNNFLYQYPNMWVPYCLRSRKRINLVDAGIFNNMPYPPFLGGRRDIDLMISLEFSAGEAFQTLMLARDYAAKVGKPFPKIGDKILLEKDWPQDFYVFQGEGREPTIIYMPLFNRRNCKDPGEVLTLMSLFQTFQMPYSQTNTKTLLEVASGNLHRNRDAILTEIHKAALRKQARR